MQTRTITGNAPNQCNYFFTSEGQLYCVSYRKETQVQVQNS